MSFRVRSTKTVFGHSLNVDKAVPTHLMLVCVNRGGGWEPKKVLLPHQLYAEDVMAWLKEQPDIHTVAVFPVDHDSYKVVWEPKR